MAPPTIFVEMVDLSRNNGGLPSRRAGIDASNIWEWRGDGIYFLGATKDTQIRLRYSKGVSRIYRRCYPHRFLVRQRAGSHCLRHRPHSPDGRVAARSLKNGI